MRIGNVPNSIDTDRYTGKQKSWLYEHDGLSAVPSKQTKGPGYVGMFKIWNKETKLARPCVIWGAIVGEALMTKKKKNCAKRHIRPLYVNFGGDIFFVWFRVWHSSVQPLFLRGWSRQYFAFVELIDLNLNDNICCSAGKQKKIKKGWAELCHTRK